MKYVLKDETGKVIAEIEAINDVQAAAFENAGYTLLEEKKK